MRCSKVSLIRPINSVMVGLGILVGEVIAYSGIPPLKHAILGFLVGFLASAGIMALNDYFDVEIDRINAPRRPIPCGAVSARAALIVGILSVLSAVALAFLQSFPAGLFAGFTLALDVLYDARLKKTGFPGNVIVSYSVAAPFIYGALALGSGINALIAAIALMAFLSNLGREVVKGILDVAGDSAAGVRTVAVLLGPRAAATIGAALVLAAVFVSVIVPFLGPVPAIYFLVIPTTDAMLVYASIRAFSEPRKSKDLMRLAMLVALLVFIAMSLIKSEPLTRSDLREKAYLRSFSGTLSA